MVTTDTLEGNVNGSLWYHYDLANDVHYLRNSDEVDVDTYAEETPDGFLLLRRTDTDTAVGLTVVPWWKRFGHGARPDSLHELESPIESWGGRLAA
jgi:hypothetical protein